MSKDTKAQTKAYALEELRDLEKMLQDRISELHEVKGMQQCRHAYIFYRNQLWSIKKHIENL